MFTQAAFEEFQNFAENGHLGNPIALTLNPAQPEAGSHALLSWDFSHLDEENGTLIFPNGTRSVVPPEGRQELLIDQDPFSIILTAGSEEERLIVTPSVITPSIDRFDVPQLGMINEVITVSWEVREADTLRLLVLDGEEHREQHDIAARGEFRVFPRQLGNLHFNLVAESRHAAFSARARVEVARHVRVVVPPLRIDVSAHTQRVSVGREAVFRWKVSGADTLFLNALTRKQKYTVSPVGLLCVVVEAEERFELVATGFDGQEQRSQLGVSPVWPGLDDPLDELTELVKSSWK